MGLVLAIFVTKRWHVVSRMNEFVQRYWQFLEIVAAAQDRCEAAVATMIRYDDSGQDTPKEVLAEYEDSHEALKNIIATYPRSQAQSMRLASTA